MNCENIEVIALTQKLVQIESTNVGTFEDEISKFITEWLRSNTKVEVVRDEFEPGRFNVAATLKGQVSHPNLLYIAHMDTVPVGNGWTKDPFRAEIIDGIMYGRGSCDMKAGLAATMIAFRKIENHCRQNGIIPKHDFVFVASGDEEDAMKGADYMVNTGLADKNTWVLDTEPTGGMEARMKQLGATPDPSVKGYIMMAHKGKTWFKITTKGKAAHGSTPISGVDAIIAMAEVILEIRNRIATYAAPDPKMGLPTVCFGTIHGGQNTNMVADECSIQIDMRLSPPLTTEGSLKLVEDAIVAGTARVPGSIGSYQVIAKRPYVAQNDDSFLLKSLQESCEKITGKRASLIVGTGYTDSGVIDGSTGSGNGMSYGPKGGNIHQPDEYVYCDSIIENLEVIIDLAGRILL